MNPTEFGHSISFVAQDGTTKNTWENWGLIADSRPTLSTPSPKTNVLDDVKMINGDIDLTYSMVPYPLYSNREGSFTFIYNPIFQSLYNKEQNWVDLYSEIMRFIHGRNLQMILEDDDDYYYEGRFHVEDWTSNNDGSGSTITIGYSVYPYKRSLYSSIENDPSTFWPDLMLYNIAEKSLYTDDYNEWKTIDLTNEIGDEPLIPIIYWKPIYRGSGSEGSNAKQKRRNRSLIIDYKNSNLDTNYKDIQYKYFDPNPAGTFGTGDYSNNLTSNNIVSLLPIGETDNDGFYIFKDLDMIFYDSGYGDNRIRFIGGGELKIKFHEGKL